MINLLAGQSVTEVEGCLERIHREIVDAGQFPWFRSLLTDLVRVHEGVGPLHRALQNRSAAADVPIQLAESTLRYNAEKSQRPPTSVYVIGAVILYALDVGDDETTSLDFRGVIGNRFMQEPELVDRVRQVLRETGARSEDTPEQSPELGILAGLLAASEKHQGMRMLVHDFFPRAHLPADTPQSDESYYLLFRYSTQEGAILKSFVVVQRPERAKTRGWCFFNFVWGGEHFYRDIYRETVGTVLLVENSTWMLGYNYAIDFDKRSVVSDTPSSFRVPSDLNQTRADARKDRVNALELIAFEHGSLELKTGIVPALITTSAAQHQPVISRAAMLHIGCNGSLGFRASDFLLRPQEMHARELKEDLRKTLQRLVDAQVMSTGSRIASCITISPAKGQTVVSAEVKKLADQILEMIDNTAEYERQSAKAGQGPGKLQNRGALEVYGQYRS